VRAFCRTGPVSLVVVHSGPQRVESSFVEPACKQIALLTQLLATNSWLRDDVRQYYVRRVYTVCEDGSFLSLRFANDSRRIAYYSERMRPSPDELQPLQAVKSELEAIEQPHGAPEFASSRFYFPFEASAYQHGGLALYSGPYLDIGDTGLIGTLFAPTSY